MADTDAHSQNMEESMTAPAVQNARSRAWAASILDWSNTLFGREADKTNDYQAANEDKEEMAKDKYARVHLLKRSFDEELDAMIKNPPAGSVIMDITPSIAADMLKRNVGNRTFRPKWAEELGRRIRAGKWKNTGVPLIFSEGGSLLDGQHRLHAIVEAEEPATAHVVFGVPDSAFAHIDVGKKRTAGDIFHINGVANANLMAAATNIVHGYDTSSSRTAVWKITLSESELYAVFCSHPDLPKSTSVGAAFSKCRLASPSIMTALHYICARKCRRDADDFFDRVATGAGLTSKKDPALVLRNSLIRSLTDDEKKMGRARLMALTIKAWNAARDGRPVSQLRLTDDGIPRAR